MTISTAPVKSRRLTAQISLKITAQARSILDEYSLELGIPRRVVVELALREFAETRRHRAANRKDGATQFYEA